MAFGSLLAIAAAAFGVVGFFAGLRDNPHSMQWYLAALVLGVLSGAVLLDEARSYAPPTPNGVGAWIGSVLLVGAMGLGAVGFILGLANRAHAITWLTGGVIVAIVALAGTMDELRREHSRRTTAIDGFSGLGIAFGVLGLGLGAVGFILGLMTRQYTDTWMWAGVISSAVSLGWSLRLNTVLSWQNNQAEHRLRCPDKGQFDRHSQ